VSVFTQRNIVTRVQDGLSALQTRQYEVTVNYHFLSLSKHVHCPFSIFPQSPFTPIFDALLTSFRFLLDLLSFPDILADGGDCYGFIYLPNRKKLDILRDRKVVRVQNKIFLPPHVFHSARWRSSHSGMISAGFWSCYDFPHGFTSLRARGYSALYYLVSHVKPLFVVKLFEDLADLPQTRIQNIFQPLKYFSFSLSQEKREIRNQ
jgi:hypothetical protein